MTTSGQEANTNTNTGSIPSLQGLIQASGFLGAGDKDFLLQKISTLSPVEKLRLKHSLESNQAPQVLQQLQYLRTKFYETEAASQPPKPNLIQQIAAKINPPKPKQPVSFSILSNPTFIGSSPISWPPVKPIQLNHLTEFNSLDQLASINARHITFGSSSSGQQQLQNFLFKIDAFFEKLPDIISKRQVLTYYLRSPLYRAYLQTGITAIKHTELEPRNIVLNTLYQIDGRYLNQQQFKTASRISNHLRNLCGL